MDRAPKCAGDVDVVEARLAREARILPSFPGAAKRRARNPYTRSMQDFLGDSSGSAVVMDSGLAASRRPGMTSYIFSKRFALPLRILALSSSESGTVCIQSSAGGFMTNGQSTAKRI